MSDTCTRVEAILRNYAGLAADYSINNETELVRDLQFDSLDLISVAMQIEDEFNIAIPDEDVDKPALGTFGGLVAHIEGARMARNEVWEVGKTVTSPALEERVKTAIERADMTTGTAIG